VVGHSGSAPLTDEVSLQRRERLVAPSRGAFSSFAETNVVCTTGQLSAPTSSSGAAWFRPDIAASAAAGRWSAPNFL